MENRSLKTSKFVGFLSEYHEYQNGEFIAVLRIPLNGYDNSNRTFLTRKNIYSSSEVLKILKMSHDKYMGFVFCVKNIRINPCDVYNIYLLKDYPKEKLIKEIDKEQNEIRFIQEIREEIEQSTNIKSNL